MADNADTPITVSDVAAHLGVSLRSLQAGFRQWRNTTPNAYLRQVGSGWSARASALRTETNVTTSPCSTDSCISAVSVPGTVPRSASPERDLATGSCGFGFVEPHGAVNVRICASIYLPGKMRCANSSADFNCTRLTLPLAPRGIDGNANNSTATSIPRTSKDA